jgi:hypothetical protein
MRCPLWWIGNIVIQIISSFHEVKENVNRLEEERSKEVTIQYLKALKKLRGRASVIARKAAQEKKI